MKNKKVITTTDLIFKKVFASPQNSHILIGFINDILGLDIEDVSIEDTSNIRSFYNEKDEPELRYTKLDILARVRGGILVNIEMQVYKQLFFKERAVFYTAETYISNYGKHELELQNGTIAKGESKYTSLRPVYSINIMAENEFKDDKPIHEFRLYDTENKMLYKGAWNQDMITIKFLELKKASDEMQENVKDWFDYFNTGQVDESAPEYIHEACKVADYQNLPKEEKEMVDAREKAEQDELARRDYQRMIEAQLEEMGAQLEEMGAQLEEKGAQLEEKGVQLEEKEMKLKQEQIKMAQKLLLKGISIEEIRELMDLNDKELEELGASI